MRTRVEDELRDRFAGLAMQALINREIDYSDSALPGKKLAEEAYAIAKAMMEHRAELGDHE